MTDLDPEFVDDVAEAVLRAEPIVTTAAELSRQLGEDVSDVLQALRTLEYQGDVKSKETGSNAIAWWHVERETHAPPKHPADHPRQRDLEETTEPDRQPTREPHTEPNRERVDEDGRNVPTDDVDDQEPSIDVEQLDADQEEIVEAVRAFYRNRPPKKEHANDAVLDVHRLLLEESPRSTSELKEQIYARYGENYSSEKAAWESLKRYLDESPVFHSPAYGEYAIDVDAARDELL